MRDRGRERGKEIDISRGRECERGRAEGGREIVKEKESRYIETDNSERGERLSERE